MHCWEKPTLKHIRPAPTAIEWKEGYPPVCSWITNWKTGSGRPSTRNQSVVKTCPECTRSSPRRLPEFPNRLLLIESSVSRRLWAKSLRKVVVGPSIKGEFQNVYLTCFETGALSESKLAFGRACKTSCVLFRRTNDILRVHAKKNFQKISSQSKMTTKFCLQFFFSLTVVN